MKISEEKQRSTVHRLAVQIFSRNALPYWLILGLALGVRIADQYFMSHNAPTYGLLWPDSHVYDRWAREISQTFWLGWDRIPFSHGPLYPYYLGMLYLRFGAGIAVAAWSQRLLGSITVVLLFWLGRRLFGKRAGWFAGIGAAACPLFLMYEGEILLETLLLFLHVTALCVFCLAFERKTLRWWPAGGVLIGLCSLARPNALLFIPVLSVWAALATGGNRQRRGLHAVTLGMAAIAVIAPATLLNLFVGGKFCLITKSGAFNTYIGNAPDTTGIFASTPSAIAIREQEGKPDEEIDWRTHLFIALRTDPWSFPRNLWLKLKLFWQSGEIPSGPNYYLQRDFSPLLRLPFRWAAIAPLGLMGMGMVLFRKKNWRMDDPRLLAAGWLFLFMVSIVLVFVMGRLRLPALAILFLFAGYALAWITETIEGAWRGTLPVGRLIGVAALLAVWPLLGLLLKTSNHDALIGWNDYFNLGRAYESQNRHQAALEQYERALQLKPDAELLITLIGQQRERLGRE